LRTLFLEISGLGSVFVRFSLDLQSQRPSSSGACGSGGKLWRAGNFLVEVEYGDAWYFWILLKQRIFLSSKGIFGFQM
jgi:hypothetical protein